MDRPRPGRPRTRVFTSWPRAHGPSRLRAFRMADGRVTATGAWPARAWSGPAGARIRHGHGRMARPPSASARHAGRGHVMTPRARGRSAGMNTRAASAANPTGIRAVLPVLQRRLGNLAVALEFRRRETAAVPFGGGGSATGRPRRAVRLRSSRSPPAMLHLRAWRRPVRPVRRTPPSRPAGIRGFPPAASGSARAPVASGPHVMRVEAGDRRPAPLSYRGRSGEKQRPTVEMRRCPLSCRGRRFRESR